MSHDPGGPRDPALVRVEMQLRRRGLAWPETSEAFPWEHRALKVRGKAFAFLAWNRGALCLSLKLPESAHEALLLPFAEPTGYGLGKSGWVTSTFTTASPPPLGILEAWLEESYRAVAPKKVVAQLDNPSAAARPRTARPRASKPRGTSPAGRRAPARPRRRDS